MNILAVEHIAINVLDYQKTRSFYGDLLGFKEVDTIDCGDFFIHYFQLPSNQRLEFFEYKDQKEINKKSERIPGLRHLAFQVTDVASHEQELRAQGIEITLSTCDLPNLGTRVLLFLDPNGVTLEFCEKL